MAEPSNSFQPLFNSRPLQCFSSRDRLASYLHVPRPTPPMQSQSSVRFRSLQRSNQTHPEKLGCQRARQRPLSSHDPRNQLKWTSTAWLTGIVVLPSPYILTPYVPELAVSGSCCANWVDAPLAHKNLLKTAIADCVWNHTELNSN